MEKDTARSFGAGASQHQIPLSSGLQRDMQLLHQQVYRLDSIQSNSKRVFKCLDLFIYF